MSLNFPADPSQNPTYEAPNGVTYIWNDSIQSWVVQSVTYDDDYVNRTGDTMTGNLNFASNELGIYWGGNPRILFKPGGTAYLRGNFSVDGAFKFTSNGPNLTNNNSVINFKGSNRLKFNSIATTLVFDDQDLLEVNASGVEYHGNFTQPKNVTTVEYVTTEIQNVQDEIDALTADLESTIEGVINDKAVLIEGSQKVAGTKTFTTQLLIDRGEDIGGNAVNSFVIKGKVGSSNQYSVLLKDYRRPDGNNSNDSVLYYGAISADNDIVNKKYITDNTLKSVSGTSGAADDTGIRTNSKSNGNQQIYAVKATKDQYGVNVRGLLPQGTNNPSNSELKVGQMYFNTTSKRVFIRVS